MKKIKRSKQLHRIKQVPIGEGNKLAGKQAKRNRRASSLNSKKNKISLKEN